MYSLSPPLIEFEVITLSPSISKFITFDTWLDLKSTDKNAIKSLEKMSVVNSLTNLKSYPKINELIIKKLKSKLLNISFNLINLLLV